MDVYLLAVLTALLGSLHCAGMCGGFPALVMHLNQGSKAWWAVGRYLAGKTLVYSLLGAVAGLGGLALIHLLTKGQWLMSLLAGLAFIALGFSFLGINRESASSFSGLSRLMSSVLRQRSGGAMALGMLNGLLPCPIIYGMLLLAASSASMAKGALLMAVLGFGTIPVLVAAGWLSRTISPLWKRHAQRVGGVLLIALGGITLMRGWTQHDASHSSPLQVGQVHHEEYRTESEHDHRDYDAHGR